MSKRIALLYKTIKELPGKLFTVTMLEFASKIRIKECE